MMQRQKSNGARKQTARQPEQPHFSTVMQASSELGLPAEFLREKAEAGAIPCYRFEGRFYIEVAGARQALADALQNSFDLII